MGSPWKGIKDSPEHRNVFRNYSEIDLIKENAVTIFLVANTLSKCLISSICRGFMSLARFQAT